MKPVEKPYEPEFEAPPGGYYRDHPDWKCSCSCGRVSKVRFSERLGHYVAQEKGWVFNTEGDSRGWTCGQPGHKRGANVCLDPKHPSNEQSFGLAPDDDEEEDEES